MAKKPLPLRIDEDLLARIDAARGDIPRTTWIVRALEAALSNGQVAAEPRAQSPRTEAAPPRAPTPAAAKPARPPAGPLAWSRGPRTPVKPIRRAK